MATQSDPARVNELAEAKVRNVSHSLPLASARQRVGEDSGFRIVQSSVIGEHRKHERSVTQVGIVDRQAARGLFGFDRSKRHVEVAAGEPVEDSTQLGIRRAFESVPGP